LSKCFTRDRNSRPTASTLCEHPWIRKHVPTSSEIHTQSYEEITDLISRSTLSTMGVSCSSSMSNNASGKCLLFGQNAVIAPPLHARLTSVVNKRRAARNKYVGDRIKYLARRILVSVDVLNTPICMHACKSQDTSVSRSGCDDCQVQGTRSRERYGNAAVGEYNRPLTRLIDLQSC
jgi:hypothetical protein